MENKSLPSTPEETGPSNAGKFPITLNAAQEEAVKGWALSCNLFADAHVAEFNLRTFARLIISRGAAPSSVTPPQDELEHMKSQRDYLQRVCSKIQIIVGQSDLPDRSSELDVLPSSVAILAARASSPSSAIEQEPDFLTMASMLCLNMGRVEEMLPGELRDYLKDIWDEMRSSAGTPEGK